MASSGCPRRARLSASNKTIDTVVDVKPWRASSGPPSRTTASNCLSWNSRAMWSISSRSVSLGFGSDVAGGCAHTPATSLGPVAAATSTTRPRTRSERLTVSKMSLARDDARWTKRWRFLKDENLVDATRVMSVLLADITTERDTVRVIVQKELVVLLGITVDGPHPIDQVSHLDVF